MYAIEGVILFILFYLAQVYTFEYKHETHGNLSKCAGLFTLDQQGPIIVLVYLHIITTEFLINMYKFYRLELGIYDSNNSILHITLCFGHGASRNWLLLWNFFNMLPHQKTYPSREAQTPSANNHPSNHQPAANNNKRWILSINQIIKGNWK